MPAPSGKTAWDFLPDGWEVERLRSPSLSDRLTDSPSHAEFTTVRGEFLRVTFPRGFAPRTQLESARLGIVTPQMQRVAEREPHFEALFPGRAAQAVRDEVAAGRMVIPANVHHLKHRLDPMAIGRASRTKVNAVNMGASPVSSGTAEELEKLDWAVRWGADNVMDLSTGDDLDECRATLSFAQAHIQVPAVSDHEPMN